MRPCARCLSNAGLTDSAPHRRRNFRATAAGHQQTSSLPIATEVRPRCRRQGRTSTPHRRRRLVGGGASPAQPRAPKPVAAAPAARPPRRRRAAARSPADPTGKMDLSAAAGMRRSELRPRAASCSPRRRRHPLVLPACRECQAERGAAAARSRRRRRQRPRAAPAPPSACAPQACLAQTGGGSYGCRAASSSTTRRRHPTNPESRAFYMWGGRRVGWRSVRWSGGKVRGLSDSTRAASRPHRPLRSSCVPSTVACLAPCVLRCSASGGGARPSAVGRRGESVTRRRFV